MPLSTPHRPKSARRYDAEFSPQRSRVPGPAPLPCSSVLPATATRLPPGLRTRRSEEGVAGKTDEHRRGKGAGTRGLCGLNSAWRIFAGAGSELHMRLVTIDLAENCRLVPSGGGSSVDCDFRIEGKLRAGKHANRGAGIARSGEPARAGAEITRSKLIANARGTRFDVHQAIVAHGIGSSVPHLLR